MAASNVNALHSTYGSGPSLYEKLNSVWHERALQIFMVIVLAHWGEHLVQEYQVYVLHWPRPKAGGILGLWYPWLITSEWLHYGYAIVMLIGIFWGAAQRIYRSGAEVVDGCPGDSVLASHRAFAAADAGDTASQFLE